MQAEAEACIVRQVWASDSAIGIRMVWPGAGTDGRFDFAAANPDFDADADFEVTLLLFEKIKAVYTVDSAY
jgi:hypothetical protein